MSRDPNQWLWNEAARLTGNAGSVSQDMARIVAAQVQAFDLDHVFTLAHTGANEWKISEPANVWAPEVFHSESEDVEIMSDDWESVMHGRSGQDSYRGCVMHSSEFVGAGIGQHLMDLAEDEPQTFVVVEVSCHPEGEDEDPEPAGWTILRRKV